MKKLLLLLCCLTWIQSQAQSPSDLFNAARQISRNSDDDKLNKRWFSTAEVAFGVNNEVEYSYSRTDNNGKSLGGGSTNLDKKASFGLLYSINYPVFNRLTLGAIGGFQYQGQQSISALKVGGTVRYHFTNYESVNINLMTAYNIALSNNIGSEMGNVRLGLQFPIARLDGFNLNMNVFWDYNQYQAKEPMLPEALETPSTISFRSYGISLGALF